jgi:hypothetical protein
MRKLRAASRLLLIGAGLTTLVGCSHTVAAGNSRTIRIALSEYRVSPQRIRSAPGELTLVVENDGRLAHDLAISSHGTIVGQTPPLQPGTRSDLVLTLGPGSYLMTSTLFSDQALGTYGTLTVTR